MEVRNIEELLQPYLKNGKKLISFTQKKLLSTGENYGSVMLKVEIFIDNNGKEEVIKCVAKLVPPRGILWDIFNTSTTFKKEIAVYNSIVPALNQFGKEHGIECILPFLAEYYNSRVTLKPNSNDVDDDAIILLKNLQEDGYKVEDRFTGFNKEYVIMIIKNLATLHATALAYKHFKPMEFQNKIMIHIEKCWTVQLGEKGINDRLNRLKTFLEECPKLNHLCERISNRYIRGMNNLSQQRISNEPFSTLIHGDLWTNNILIKNINEKSEPEFIKFVDFQIIEFGNPARDVIFFLYTSAQIDLLENIDEFLLIYYNHFIDTLKTFKYDPTSFSYETLLKLIDDAAKETEFSRIMMMLPAVFIERGKAAELSDIKNKSNIVTSDQIHPNFLPRFASIIQGFAKRGWI